MSNDPELTGKVDEVSEAGEKRFFKPQLPEVEVISLSTMYKTICTRLVGRYADVPARSEKVKQILAEEIDPYLEAHPGFRDVLFQVLNDFSDYPERQENIVNSLMVPQIGEYHHEGPRMISHLDLILQNLIKIKAGQFAESIDPKDQKMMSEVVKSGSDQIDTAQANSELPAELVKYLFLHDIAKTKCLTLKSQQGTTANTPRQEYPKKEISWVDWIDIEAKTAPGQSYLFQPEGKEELYPVDEVSYFHSSEDHKGTHGNKAVDEDLKDATDIPGVIKTAIRMHEVAYLFDVARAKIYRDHFEKFSDLEQRFIMVACYVDAMSALREDGKPDLTNVKYLLTARNNYQLIEKFTKWCEANGKKVVKKNLAGLKDQNRELGIDDLKKAIEPSYDLAALEERLKADARFNEAEIATIIENVNVEMGIVARAIKAKIGILRTILPDCEMVPDISDFS